METKLTAVEISSLLDVAKRTVNRWANTEKWPSVQELVGGLVVRKYIVELMPVPRQEALTNTKAVAVSSHGMQLAIIEDDLPQLSTLKGWQREVMDARVALFREFKRLESRYGTSLAIKEFTSKSKKGTLPEHLQKFVAIANARGGKNGRAISKSTIYRWKAMEKKGLAAFAPACVEKKVVPAWADYFFTCYQIPTNPSIPEAIEEMAKILPESIAMPSYYQVRRFHNKRSRLDRERGRKTGSAFIALKGHKTRDTSNYKPLGLGICDGHSFKAKVAHPIHGKPFKPEICAIIDAATRVIVGWSTGLAESATTVADAVRHSATVSESKPFGGIFDTLYTDGGSGNVAKINTDEFTGLFPRIGTTHETGRAGNAQARGIIERLTKQPPTRSRWV
jgi:putative transposase